jgi:hypothetical protein
MGQTADQLEHRIENAREDLKTNLEELESRVKSAADWRHHYRQHTGVVLAAAFGAGALLAMLAEKRRARDGETTTPASLSSSAEASRTVSQAKQEVLQHWHSIRSALLGAAAIRARDALSQIVPGFSEQFRELDGNHRRNATH